MFNRDKNKITDLPLRRCLTERSLVYVNGRAGRENNDRL